MPLQYMFGIPGIPFNILYTLDSKGKVGCLALVLSIFMATFSPVSVLVPKKTFPQAPAPIFLCKMYLSANLISEL